MLQTPLPFATRKLAAGPGSHKQPAELEGAGSGTSGHPAPQHLDPLATGRVFQKTLGPGGSSHSKIPGDTRSCPARPRGLGLDEAKQE